MNDAAGFQCFPAIGFDDEYAFNPDRLLDEDGKALKPGYNHGKKHHRGMGRASAGDAEQEKIIAQQEEDVCARTFWEEEKEGLDQRDLRGQAVAGRTVLYELLLY